MRYAVGGAFGLHFLLHILAPWTILAHDGPLLIALLGAGTLWVTRAIRRAASRPNPTPTKPSTLPKEQVMHRYFRSSLLLAALLLIPQTAAAQGWLYSQATDPMTDADRSAVGTVDEGGDALLAWRCMSDGLNVNVKGDYFGDAPKVQYRFDADTPVGPTRWEASTDGTSAFAPMRIVSDLTADAIRSTRLVLRIYDYAGTPNTYTFSLIGFSEQLKRLSCS